MNLVSIKKHETTLCKNEPTFLFSSEGIPITHQHTDPHWCPLRTLKKPLAETLAKLRKSYQPTIRNNFQTIYKVVFVSSRTDAPELWI